jgi:hypothetical protein
VIELLSKAGKSKVSSEVSVLLPGDQQYTKVVFTPYARGFQTGNRCKEWNSRNAFTSPLQLAALHSPRAPKNEQSGKRHRISQVTIGCFQRPDFQKSGPWQFCAV